MSADAYVSSIRIRPPLNLSSSSRLPNRRNVQHRLLTSNFRNWGGEDREIDSALNGGARVDSDSYDLPAIESGNGDVEDIPHWIDLDRFEDWDRPTLDSLCPTIRIPFEDDLFPVAVAEDGESLPAEIHPSHPYGNLYQTVPPYNSRPKLPAHRGFRISAIEDAEGKANEMDDVSAPPHLILRARQSIAPNPPSWPFRRFGPGPGGPNALLRAESIRPWRPYKAIWADLGLEELLPNGAKVKDGLPRHVSNNDRADLPQEGEAYDTEQVLRELEEFDATHMQSGEEDSVKTGKEKKKRRVQNDWKWGQSAQRLV